MALTLLSGIAEFQPVYNELLLVVSSDNVANPNFNYVFRVLTDGGSTVKAFRRKPSPDNNYGEFDASEYLQTFVNSYLPDEPETDGFTSAVNNGFLINYEIEVYEEWDQFGAPFFNPDGLPPLTQGTRNAYEAAFNEHDLIDYNFGIYMVSLDEGAGAQFLTDMKENIVSINDIGYHYMITDVGMETENYRVVTRDSSGTILGTFEIENTIANTTPDRRAMTIATAPESLNNVTTFLFGSQPVITPSVASYTIQCFSPPPSFPTSEVLSFRVEETCRYTSYRLHFQNRFGAFDSFTFTGRNQRKSSMERSTYKRSTRNITASGQVRRHRDRSVVTNWTKRTDSITLRSDYLTTDQNNWLEQLMYSNEIYLEFTRADGVRDYKPVAQVSGTSWIEKETQHDKLFKLEIEIQLSNETYSQRK